MQGRLQASATPIQTLAKSLRYSHKHHKQHYPTRNMRDNQNTNVAGNITVKINHKILEDAVMNHGEYPLLPLPKTGDTQMAQENSNSKVATVIEEEEDSKMDPAQMTNCHAKTADNEEDHLIPITFFHNVIVDVTTKRQKCGHNNKHPQRTPNVGTVTKTDQNENSKTNGTGKYDKLTPHNNETDLHTLNKDGFAYLKEHNTKYPCMRSAQRNSRVTSGTQGNTLARVQFKHRDTSQQIRKEDKHSKDQDKQRNQLKPAHQEINSSVHEKYLELKHEFSSCTKIQGKDNGSTTTTLTSGKGGKDCLIDSECARPAKENNNSLATATTSNGTLRLG